MPPGNTGDSLDGEVVGMDLGSRSTDPPSTERLPSTVHSDRDEGFEPVHEPVDRLDA